PLKNTVPLSLIVTFHFCPTTFESTSNSTSSRPLSGPAFSFQSLFALQAPVLITSSLPRLANAAGAPARIDAAIRPASPNRNALPIAHLPAFPGPGVPDEPTP